MFGSVAEVAQGIVAEVLGAGLLVLLSAGVWWLRKSYARFISMDESLQHLNAVLPDFKYRFGELEETVDGHGEQLGEHAIRLDEHGHRILTLENARPGQ